MRERIQKFYESYPVKVVWAGWETDTFKLATSGWQLAANQDIIRNRLSLVLKHPQLQVYGYSGDIDFDYMEDVRYITIPMNYLSSNLRIQALGTINFTEISGITQKRMSYEPRDIEDLKIFREVKNQPSSSLLIPKEGSQEIIDLVYKKADQNHYKELLNKQVLMPEKVESLIILGKVLGV